MIIILIMRPEVDYLTNGQASTCLLSEKYIQKNCILNVGACDIGFSYKHENYLKTLKNYNSFIWTYNNNKNVLFFCNLGLCLSRLLANLS